MSEPEKMELTSMDVAEEKREELRRILKDAFPEVFTEGSIVFDDLKTVLGELVDGSKERFGLLWPGKSECMKVIQQPSSATLKPDRHQSVNFDTTGNLFIEGDNLEVLKLMQKSYFGKIKMIYIDPPYNTGGEFIYPDKFSESLDTYLNYTRQVDDDGRMLSTNADTNGRFHSNWLNMMYPRVYLAKNLLKQDGVFFVSIGDDEYANLKKLCDDIFGEENFISTISRVMKTGGAKGNFFTPNVDFILVYARNIESTEYFRTGIAQYQIDGYYKNIQIDGPRKGERYGEERLYKASLDARANQRYWIECPDGSFVIPPGSTLPSKLADGEQVTPNSDDGVWKWVYSTYSAEKAKGNIIFKSTNTSALVDHNGNPSKYNIYNKLWLKEQQEKGKVPSNYLSEFENRKSSAELKELSIPFDYAKPVGLIRHLIDISRAQGDDIVLDFFAGAATTAEAVMRSNADNDGRLKFVVVQLPEITHPESEERKAGFKTISALGIERIRRAGTKIVAERDARLKLPDNEELDVGAKYLRLDRSNFSLWDGSNDNMDVARQLDFHVDHLDDTSSAEDVLYELLLKAGFPPSTNVEVVQFGAHSAFAVSNGARLCCTNPMRDSSCESSVVAGRHEQTDTPRLQDQELARL